MEWINVIRNKITIISSLADTKNYAYTLYLRLTPYEKEILEKAVGNDQCLSFLPEGVSHKGCNCVECLARADPPNPQIEAVAGLLFLRWYVLTCYLHGQKPTNILVTPGPLLTSLSDTYFTSSANSTQTVDSSQTRIRKT